ncbi:hypothetical protein BESB_009850 [Besnoitia besnoiti]|uniref:Uncharacterized protein n=1 Tax=Besnoitia besnoiti TaxID=94643 RepID=A0A2A9MQN8_BESBE|nr:hypothetical protein BESB_009850 [Besnoitia besnoiti]PFH38643.1 hypothetical protein BESB_009850 [Besnoitia besnoiti]
MLRQLMRSSPRQLDSSSALSSNGKNGEERGRRRVGGRRGRARSLPSSVGRQSTLRSGQTTDPLELVERYGPGKEVLNDCRIVPPHLNEGHSSNAIAMIRQRPRPARPSHRSLSPSAAACSERKVKTPYDSDTTARRRSMPRTFTTREKRSSCTSASEALLRFRDSELTSSFSKTPNDEAFSKFSYGGRGPGARGGNSVSRSSTEVPLVTTSPAKTAQHLNVADTPLPPPLRMEITGRLATWNHGCHVRALHSSSSPLAYIDSPRSRSRTLQSGGQRSDDVSILKRGAEKATMLNIDVWLEPFRKRINTLSDICRDMVRDIELTINSRPPFRGSSIHIPAEEDHHQSLQDLPPCSSRSVGGSLPSCQQTPQELARHKKVPFQQTWTEAGENGHCEPYKRRLIPFLPGGEGHQVISKAESGAAEPGNNGSLRFPMYNKAGNAATAVSAARGSVPCYPMASTTVAFLSGEEEHARVAAFTKHLAEIAAILRITNPDAVKRKLFVAENCPFLIPPSEAEDFFAFSIILYSLTLPQNYRWNQGVYKLPPAVHALSWELNNALLRLCRAIPEDWLLDLYNVIPRNQRAGWQQLLQTVESQLEVFTQSYRKFEVEYCTHMAKLLRMVFEPLAVMCRESRVLLDKANTGPIEGVSWISYEPPRNRKHGRPSAFPAEQEETGRRRKDSPAQKFSGSPEQGDEKAAVTGDPLGARREQQRSRTAMMQYQRSSCFEAVCETNLLQRLYELYTTGRLSFDCDPVETFDPGVLYRAKRIRSFR